jgi:hypothetical protein
LVFGLATYQVAIQQREIEDGVRTQVGIWLRDHVAIGESVHLEPIGYIGFYSGAKLLDWPGLVSAEVVASRKRHDNRRGDVILDLEPEWLVLRPGEMRYLMAHPGIDERYDPVHAVDATEVLNRYKWIPGERFLRFDSVFVILRRASLPDHR